MTMPHLMNCSHSNDGWCLWCVKELCDEEERKRERLEILFKSIERYINWCKDCYLKVKDDE